jgi:hypothetical protein
MFKVITNFLMELQVHSHDRLWIAIFIILHPSILTIACNSESYPFAFLLI